MLNESCLSFVLVPLFRSGAETLFILVRDVPSFEESYAEDVLAFVRDLGFTGPDKEPQRIIQEGCLPFDPATFAARKKVGFFARRRFFLLLVVLRDAWCQALHFFRDSREN